jgi:hypothetical protein
MHEQHAGWAADRTAAMAAAADIVGEKHVPVAALALLPVAGFDFQSAGQHKQKLTSGSRVPILVKALGHLCHHGTLCRQHRGAVDGITERVGRRVVDRDFDLDKLRPAIG